MISPSAQKITIDCHTPPTPLLEYNNFHYRKLVTFKRGSEQRSTNDHWLGQLVGFDLGSFFREDLQSSLFCTYFMFSTLFMFSFLFLRVGFRTFPPRPNFTLQMLDTSNKFLAHIQAPFSYLHLRVFRQSERKTTAINYLRRERSKQQPAVRL